MELCEREGKLRSDAPVRKALVGSLGSLTCVLEERSSNFHRDVSTLA